MSVIAYLRSSTDNNEDSLPAQLDACKAAFPDIDAVYEDKGLSGALSVADRPGLSAAIAALEPGDVLVVHRLDRLARELHVSEAALALIWKAGARCFEAVGPREVPQDDPDDPVRTMIRQILGSVAEYERKMIRARVVRGRRRKAATGGYIGGNRLHRKYGYELIGGEYVPIEAEQAVIERSTRLRDDGLSYRQIAAALTAEGIEPPSSGRWHDNSIRRILAAR